MEKFKTNCINCFKKSLLILVFVLLSATSVMAEWKVDEGFEGGSLPSGWVINNNPDDGGWFVYNSSDYAHTGDYSAGASASSAGNEDWLITPQVLIESGDSLIFYSRSWYSTEGFEVMLSTAGNDISDFDVTLAGISGVTDTYTRYAFNLSAYNGQNVYLAIKWTYENYALLVDDVLIGQEISAVDPVIELPESFNFEEGQELEVDFTPYITVEDLAVAELSVSGNTNVGVVIDGFSVTFTSTGWNGTETLTFTVDDNQGKATAFDVVDVIVNPAVVAGWQIDEDFEGGVLPDGWVINNSDDDGWWIYNQNALSGEWCAIAYAYGSGNEDWLIMPQVTAVTGDSVIFYARSWYSTEGFQLMLSTTGNDIADFNVTLADVSVVTSDYARYAFDLSAYNGQDIYLAIKWTYENYAICVDDVKVGQEPGGVIDPVIELPESFTFEEAQELIVDFTQYITVEDLEVAELSVSGNTNVGLVIDGFSVTFASPGWNGTEILIFTVDDNQGKAVASDTVDVIVTPIPLFDISVLSLDIPTEYTYLNYDINPSGKIKNVCDNQITEDFNITCEIFNSSSEVVYSSIFNHTGNIEPEDTVTINFSDIWTPDTEGIYSVRMITNLNGDDNTDNDTLIIETSVVEHFGISESDDFGYQWIDSYMDGGPEYNWIELSETGTSAISYGFDYPYFAGDDNFSAPVPFGFSFPFYGIERDSFYVDINGEILLTDNNWYNEYPEDDWDTDGFFFNYVYPIPGFTQMPALVSVYWDNLYADEGIGDVYFQTFGEVPNRYCVVEWYNLRFDAGTVEDTTLTFEVVFHENGDMIYQYKTTAIGQTGSTAIHDNGQSSTVGIQNDDATIGLCYLRELAGGGEYHGVEPEGNMLQDGLAIRFFMGEDNQAPVFTYDEPGNTFDNSPELFVKIVDMTGILYDSLYYNTGVGWQAISHSHIAGPDTFYYQLPEIANGATVNYYFSATDNSDNNNSGTYPENAPANTLSFKVLPTEGTKILFAHPGTVPGYMDYQNLNYPKYIAALDSIGEPYDIYNWAENEEYDFPESYEAIFLYSNSSHHDDKHETLSSKLINFLDSGAEEDNKNVFFASDNFAHARNVTPYMGPMQVLFKGYFRVYYIPPGSPGYPPYGGTDGLGGPYDYDYHYGSILSMGSPVCESGIEMPVYADSPDALSSRTECPTPYDTMVQNPEIGSHSAFKFEDGPFDGRAYCYDGFNAIYLDNLIYKTYYMSFDISQFTNDADINMIIAGVADWFGVGPVGIGDAEKITAPKSFALEQNYPNPFNPTTTISYQIPKTGNVKLEIFNIVGQKVRTLVNTEQKADCYNITWDSKNEVGINVATGIYFYRLSVNSGQKENSFVKSKKMLLVK